MNFSGDRKNRGIGALEVTPLVDVVFLLLIFFMLTATYVKNPSLDINLPKASVDQVANNNKDVTVAIKADGSIKFNNTVVTLEKLEGLMRSEYAQNEEAVVVVRADEGSRHGDVVQVMDLAKRVGFGKLAIAIQARAAATAGPDKE